MTKSNTRISINTKLSQALHFLDRETGSVVPAIQPAATYARDERYETRKPYWYRRDGNQTTSHAEQIIKELEDAKDTLLFASGMSACSAVIENIPEGSHIVIPKVIYHGILNLFKVFETKNRFRISFYTPGNTKELAKCIKLGDTSLVWVETPNNPNWEVTDISVAAALAHKAGALLVTDCTATPPTMTKALDFGADISFHSATKYLNGHSDVTAGVLSTRKLDGLWEKIEETRKLQGTVLHSHDSWLLIRGMRTLFLRVQESSKNAMKIASHLENHIKLETVLYPGLPNHPGHEIAKRQTEGQFGGMMSIVVKGSSQNAIDVARFCQIFYPATSLGGVESLIEHRKTVSGEDFPVHPSLLRLSIGIEDVDDLISDLEQALEKGVK